MTIPRVLVVAGSDSGGGAGIQADIKTISALGGHAMTAITAVTAQNTVGLSAVHPIPPDIVIAQIRACIEDIGVDAIKVGMLGSATVARAVAEVVATAGVPVVLDPVMVATSGAVLANADTIAAFDRLMALATLITPNVPELTALTGHVIGDEAEAVTAGHALAAAMGAPVLAKGGHLLPHQTAQVALPEEARTTDLLADTLILPDGMTTVWTNPRVDTSHTHGTGCTLASAVATGLGAGLTLEDAVAQAIRFVRLALERAPGLGHGHGPMGQQFVSEIRCRA